jgi:hypothetical protein
MEKIIINLLKQYELILISISIILFNLFSDNFKNEYIQLTVNFFTILSILHIAYIFLLNIIKVIKLIFSKVNESISFSESIERIEQLPEEQIKILHILYLNGEDKFHSYTKEIKSLIDNKYIILIQNIQGTLNLYKLDKKVYKHLDKKRSSKIRDYLTTLSDNEKYVLNQFYENTQKDYYKYEYYKALEELIKKEIIERKNDEMIVISKYAKDLLKYYSKKEIKNIEIEFGKHNTCPSGNIGSGATGGGYRY